MWDHDCKVEKVMMSVEDGKECNWCGRREEDEGVEFGKLGPNEFPDDELEDYLQNEESKSFDAHQATRDTLEQFDLEEEIMNEDEIQNVEVTDMPDGSAKITMDLSALAQQQFIKQGLQYLIEEMRMNDKVKVLDPNDFDKETKTWELDDEEANALFHFGFIHALKLGMDKEEI